MEKIVIYPEKLPITAVKIDPKSNGYANADVCCFLEMIGHHVGSRATAAAMIVRQSREYTAWRNRVEWCDVCKAFAPIDPMDDQGMTRFVEHMRPQRDPVACTGSRKLVRWQGHRTMTKKEDRNV